MDAFEPLLLSYSAIKVGVTPWYFFFSQASNWWVQKLWSGTFQVHDLPSIRTLKLLVRKHCQIEMDKLYLSLLKRVKIKIIF